MGGGAVGERYVTLGLPSSVTKRYKGVGGAKLSGEKRYVTLEWPPRLIRGRESTHWLVI